MKKLWIIWLIFGLIASFIFSNNCAQASYYNGFTNSKIQITSPNTSGIVCNDTLFIKGTSDLNEVWFCVRGPQQEITIWKADINDNTFSISINLRFGPGQYTIWAGDNPKRFDGTIRFIVDHDSEDNRYTSASMYVDSTNSDIVNLATLIAPDSLSPREKVENIHSWITAHIAYDYIAYLMNDVQLVTASQILKDRKGLCRDFSFLFAALARAADIPTKVVYGYAKSGNRWKLHAWNKVLIAEEWLSVDCSWDAGYVLNNEFVHVPSKIYLAPDPNQFALTHRVIMTTVY